MTLTKPVNRRILLIAGVLAATGAVAGTTLYEAWNRAVPLAGMAVTYHRSWSTPAGTTTTELNAATATESFIAVPAVLRVGDGESAASSKGQMPTPVRDDGLRLHSTGDGRVLAYGPATGTYPSIAAHRREVHGAATGH